MTCETASELQFKQQLLNEYQQLQQNLYQQLAASTEPDAKQLLSSLEFKPVSQWVELVRSAELGLCRRSVDRLEKVEAALCQFDLGLYGYCADCEQIIDQQRLTQDPAEQRCAHCSSK